jgi:amino-acid N-acetyltransferase
VAVEVARLADLEDIRTLLRCNGLPTEDLDDNGVQSHWVWRDAARVVGTVGLDTVGAEGVIRSLVTHPDFRREGIASALCDVAEREAGRRGVTAVYLLTESAADFAQGRGYQTVNRATVPDSVARHRQFASGCCQCSCAMVKWLS